MHFYFDYRDLLAVYDVAKLRGEDIMPSFHMELLFMVSDRVPLVRTTFQINFDFSWDTFQIELHFIWGYF